MVFTPSSGPVKPLCAMRTAIWPMKPLWPAYQLRTVAPLSMVWRLVAMQQEAARLARLRRLSAGRPRRRATASAEPTTPKVPWGLTMSLGVVAMPMRATAS